MPKVSVLIAAAGRGSRAGLPYPKTLHPVAGKPILVRILQATAHIDRRPTIIVSPQGKAPILECLESHDLAADLVEQARPEGMGNAVLQFHRSPAYERSTDVLLIWGDIPFARKQTIDAMVAEHLASGNAMTLVTAEVSEAYTVVERNPDGQVVGIRESREFGFQPSPGERDIGVFIFRKEPVLRLLAEDHPARLGQSTGEHGFLYLVSLLAAQGQKVGALPIATADELISLNRLSDIGPQHEH